MFERGKIKYATTKVLLTEKLGQLAFGKIFSLGFMPKVERFSI